MSNIVASLFILYGTAGIIGVAYLYYAGVADDMFSGINIYKVPANIVGGLSAITGGVRFIYGKSGSLSYIAISILTYLLGASYEIVLAHGIYFYNHIMMEFFWSAGVQIGLFMFLVLGNSNKGNPHMKHEAGSGDGFEK